MCTQSVMSYSHLEPTLVTKMANVCRFSQASNPDPKEHENARYMHNVTISKLKEYFNCHIYLFIEGWMGFLYKNSVKSLQHCELRIVAWAVNVTLKKRDISV